MPALVVAYKGRTVDTLKNLFAAWMQGANAFHKTGLSTLQVSVSDNPGTSCPANPSLIGLSTLYHLACGPNHDVNKCSKHIVWRKKKNGRCAGHFSSFAGSRLCKRVTFWNAGSQDDSLICISQSLTGTALFMAKSCATCH